MPAKNLLLVLAATADRRRSGDAPGAAMSSGS